MKNIKNIITMILVTSCFQSSILSMNNDTTIPFLLLPPATRKCSYWTVDERQLVLRNTNFITKNQNPKFNSVYLSLAPISKDNNNTKSKDNANESTSNSSNLIIEPALSKSPYLAKFQADEERRAQIRANLTTAQEQIKTDELIIQQAAFLKQSRSIEQILLLHKNK